VSSDRPSRTLLQRLADVFRPRNAVTSYPTPQGVSFATGLWQWPDGSTDPDAHAAAFMAKDLLGRLLSTLPVHEYVQETGAGGRQLLTPVDEQPMLLVEPEPDLGIEDWLYAQMQAVLNTGMAFALVTDANGPSDALQAPTVTGVRVRRGEAVGDPPVCFVGNREVGLWPNGPLWTLRGYPLAGSPVGLSPVGLAMRAIRLGQAAHDFASGYFADGSVPPGILKHAGLDPADPASEEVAKAVQRLWVEAQRGNREPRVLMGGWDYEPIRIMAEESQFLQTMNANAVEVVRFFGVSPEDIGASSGSSVTYANVEQRQLSLFVRALGPWIVRFERRLSRLRPAGRFVRFDIDGLLRTDAATRERIINEAIVHGHLSVNEARALNNRPGIGSDGDRNLWPPRRQQLTESELAEGADQLSPTGEDS
jgi:hypothetical protein